MGRWAPCPSSTTVSTAAAVSYGDSKHISKALSLSRALTCLCLVAERGRKAEVLPVSEVGRGLLVSVGNVAETECCSRGGY